MVDKAQMTRYEQVKQILDVAAGQSTADYDGQGHFWHLPLPQFLNVEVYGVRMIAPPEPAVHACCHHAKPAGGPPTNPAARPGLFKGLRAQPPFEACRC